MSNSLSSSCRCSANVIMVTNGLVGAAHSCCDWRIDRNHGFHRTWSGKKALIEYGFSTKHTFIF